MENKESNTLVNFLKNIYIYILAVIWLYPFYLLIASTFKNASNIFNYAEPPQLTYFDNYIAVFNKTNIMGPFLVSLTLTVSSMLFISIFGSMAGYAIGRAKEKTFKFIYLLFASGLIIPAQASMIPIYKIGVQTKLIGTIPFMVMIYVAGIATYASLIYSGFTKNIPKEMEESAAIDGAGVVRTFITIIYPLLLPATGTVLATCTYWIWNDFQGPLIYLNSEKYKTLVMLSFKYFNATTFATQWGPTFVVALLVSLPMIVFFLFTQKYLLNGLTGGAVKG